MMCVWMCVWVWVCSVSLTHTHSTHKDPHFDPDVQKGHDWVFGGDDSELSNDVAIELVGDEEAAKYLAHKYNLHYVRQVFTEPPIYHLHKPVEGNSRRGTPRHKRSTSTSSFIHMLQKEPGVRWVNQQRAFVRDKRDGRTHYKYLYMPTNAQRNRDYLNSLLNARKEGVMGRTEEDNERGREEWVGEMLGKWREKAKEWRIEEMEEEERGEGMEEWRREEEREREEWVGEEREGREERLGEAEEWGMEEMKEEEKGERMEEWRREEKRAREEEDEERAIEEWEREIGEQKILETERKNEGELEEKGGKIKTIHSYSKNHRCSKLKNLTKSSLLKSLRNSYTRLQNSPKSKTSSFLHKFRNQHSPKFNNIAKRIYSEENTAEDSRSYMDNPVLKIIPDVLETKMETGMQEKIYNVSFENPKFDSTRNKNSFHLSSTRGLNPTRGGRGQNASTSLCHSPLECPSPNSALEFNDPLYKEQWYLVNTGQLGREGWDLNVSWVWGHGFTGEGVVVSILDDGIQTTNPDIAQNYASEISYSVVRDSQPLDDPSPRLDPPTYTNSHGTYCSGVVGAVANNAICGIGVAYTAKVGGVRIVDGRVTDIQEATALSRHASIVDVFSASWGPPDDGTRVEAPGPLAKQALHYGVTKGRNGLGVIYVWASGNGGLLADNCNLDGYTSSIFTLSVAALTHTGASTFYEEPCASTLAGVFIGGSHTLQDATEMKRSHRKQMRVVVPELDGHCSQGFQGSSAAAPLMAGIVALALQANPLLTWRDVQHLVVITSTPTPQALQEYGWAKNTQGRYFHLLQGFGAVNAGNLVSTALQWQNVEPQRIFNVSVFKGYRQLRPLEWMNVTCDVTSADLTSIEHVIATISIIHPERRNLQIFIISPGGTESQVLTGRPNDQSTVGFNSWDFMSVHFWGEEAKGRWSIAVKNGSYKTGYLNNLKLQLFGT